MIELSVGDIWIHDGVARVVTGFIESEDGEVRVPTFVDMKV